MKLLGLLLIVEGKRSPNGGGLSEERGNKPTTRNRLTCLLDQKIDSDCELGDDPLQNNEKKEPNGESDACAEPSGSEVCRVLLSVYANAQPRSVEVPDEERGLVLAVLSALLALSNTAKSAALQGELITCCSMGAMSVCKNHSLSAGNNSIP